MCECSAAAEAQPELMEESCDSCSTVNPDVEQCQRHRGPGPGYGPQLRIPVYLFLLCVIAVGMVGGQQRYESWWPQDAWSPWIKPWENFDRYVFTRTYYGDVKGFSVPMYLEDEYWREEWGEYPKWFMRRVNCFLGVPYALPPTGYLRFQVIDNITLYIFIILP